MIEENLIAGESPPQTGEATLTPEQQKESTMAIIRTQQKALSQLVVLDLRNFLRMLTAPNIKEVERRQIRESIERALVMGFDYGVDVMNPVLREHGELGKLENAFAAHLARLKENGMLIMAHNIEKHENELKEVVDQTEIKQEETNGGS